MNKNDKIIDLEEIIKYHAKEYELSLSEPHKRAIRGIAREAVRQVLEIASEEATARVYTSYKDQYSKYGPLVYHDAIVDKDSITSAIKYVKI